MKIMIAVDGSKSAQNAVEFTKNLFACQKEEVEFLLVYALAPVASHYYGFEFAPLGEQGEWYDAKAREYGNKLLSDMVQALENEGYRATAALLEGDPAESIRQKAEAEKAELIVVGRRGLSVVSELALGSVSQKLLHRAKCPVLVVR